MTSIIIAIAVAGLVGAALGRARWGPLLASSIATITGWIIGSLVAAAAWLIWPPHGVEVLAVSVGLFEAGTSAGIVVALGLLVHFGAEAMAGDTSGVLAYRPVLLCIVGAFVGALGFALGAAVKPVT